MRALLLRAAARKVRRGIDNRDQTARARNEINREGRRWKPFREDERVNVEDEEEARRVWRSFSAEAKFFARRAEKIRRKTRRCLLDSQRPIGEIENGRASSSAAAI